MGVERVLELLNELGADDLSEKLDAYAVIPDVSALPKAMACIQHLRSAGVRILMHTSSPDGMASMKSQFKKADASGARFALIFGEMEMTEGMVTVKSLREVGATQLTQSLENPAQWAKSLQSTA